MSKLEQQHFERVFERVKAENPNASSDELLGLFHDAIRQDAKEAAEAWIERTRGQREG
jgi:hypothetical protein